MHDPHAGSLRGRLIQSLASLPGMNQPGQREFLLVSAGYGELARHLDVHGGSAVSFFTSLIGTLAPGGPVALADLITELARVSVAGVDRKEQLGGLAAEIRRLPHAEVSELLATGSPFAGLRARARANTLKEISDVGSKYLRDLYFHHEELEQRVEEFLADDSVCLLVVSKPGRGKTSLLCSLAERTVEDSVVLLMSARVPVSEPHGLLSLIAARLGYGTDWPGCFADLAHVSAQGSRPLLLLDAINESPATPDDMKTALHELLRQAESSGVKVVITCRTDFWQFYRSSFWGGFVRQRALAPAGMRPSSTRVEDVPLFPLDAFPTIAAGYFAAFGIRGELRGEAAERCRHALVLRILCEAYRCQDVGVVEDFRLFRLFKLFWERKVAQVADTTSLKGNGAVAELVLDVARLMREARSTTVPRTAVAARLHCGSAELDSSDSLYSRVIDEEIILEESVDDELGVRNVVFIYDRFAEYVLALSLYLDRGWSSRGGDGVVADAIALMDEEKQFPSLRGALEFLVLRLEDLRSEELLHLDVVRAMLGHNWKWRGIATLLAFQLDRRHDPSFWAFIHELASHHVDFVRRIVAEQSHRITANGDPQGLRLLNGLLWDGNRAVRAAARQAVLRLPATAVPEEARLLLATNAPDAVTLVAELIVLAPEDDEELRRRVHWLTTHGTDDRLPAALLKVLESERGTAYEELPWLARCRDAFGAAAGPLAEVYRTDVAACHERRTAELEEDRLFLMRLYEALNTDLLASFRSDPQGDPVRHLTRRRIRPDGSRQSLGQAVWRELLKSPAPRPRLIARLVGSPTWPDAQRIADLWQAMSRVAVALQKSPRPPDSMGAWVSFCRGVAKSAGLEMTDSVARGTAHPGQLALWLWHSELRRRERSGGMGALVARLEGLPVDRLVDELEKYQHPVRLAPEPLTDVLEALCHVLRDRPTVIAQVLAPLAVWHESRDSRLVDEALDELHWLDSDAFWFVVQALLNHPDQRVVGLATQVGERAEHLGESRSHDKREILDGLADIINEIAGVPTEDVRMGSSFIGDLDLDSLSLVEVIVAAEERFEVRIPDNDVRYLQTVRDAVEYVARQRGAPRA